MGVFCQFPFNHIYSDAYHMMTPCCWSIVDHPYKNDESQFKAVHLREGIDNFFHSDEMKQLRLDMMKSDPYTPLVNDVCRKCIAAEKEGLPSKRVPLDHIPFGRNLIVKLRIFGNACNLHCYMCNPEHSSGRIHQASQMIAYNPKVKDFIGYDVAQDFKVDGEGYDLAIDNPELFDTQIENLKKLAPKIKEFTIIGGEPFIMPSHYKVLDAMIEIGEAKNINLFYVSNMTTLQWQGCKVLDYVKQFKNVNVNWSVESYGKYNDYIRHPSNWNEIVENIKILKPYCGGFDPAITLSALSVIHLDELCDWILDNGLPLRLESSSLVVRPEVCRMDSLHPNIRKRLVKKYRGTRYEFLCKTLEKEVANWEQRWSDMLEYLDAIDHVNGTDYKETFPELCDLS